MALQVFNCVYEKFTHYTKTEQSNCFTKNIIDTKFTSSTFFNEPGWGIIIKQKFNVDKIQSTS